MANALHNVTHADGAGSAWTGGEQAFASIHHLAKRAG